MRLFAGGELVDAVSGVDDAAEKHQVHQWLSLSSMLGPLFRVLALLVLFVLGD